MKVFKSCSSLSWKSLVLVFVIIILLSHEAENEHQNSNNSKDPNDDKGNNPPWATRSLGFKTL